MIYLRGQKINYPLTVIPIGPLFTVMWTNMNCVRDCSKKACIDMAILLAGHMFKMGGKHWRAHIAASIGSRIKWRHALSMSSTQQREEVQASLPTQRKLGWVVNPLTHPLEKISCIKSRIAKSAYHDSSSKSMTVQLLLLLLLLLWWYPCSPSCFALA